MCMCVSVCESGEGGWRGEGFGGWVIDTEWWLHRGEAMVGVPDSGVIKAAAFHFACNRCY